MDGELDDIVAKIREKINNEDVLNDGEESED